MNENVIYRVAEEEPRDDKMYLHHYKFTTEAGIENSHFSIIPEVG